MIRRLNPPISGSAMATRTISRHRRPPSQNKEGAIIQRMSRKRQLFRAQLAALLIIYLFIHLSIPLSIKPIPQANHASIVRTRIQDSNSSVNPLNNKCNEPRPLRHTSLLLFLFSYT